MSTNVIDGKLPLKRSRRICCSNNKGKTAVELKIMALTVKGTIDSYHSNIDHNFNTIHHFIKLTLSKRPRIRTYIIFLKIVLRLGRIQQLRLICNQSRKYMVNLTCKWVNMPRGNRMKRLWLLKSKI